MKNNPIISYVWHVLAKKRSFLYTISFIALFIAVILYFTGIIYNFFALTLIGMVIWLSYFLGMGLRYTAYEIFSNYSDFKKGSYEKVIATPEEKKEIAQKAGFDVLARFESLEKRISELEKQSPIRLAVIIFLFATAITIALSLVLKYIP